MPQELSRDRQLQDPLVVGVRVFSLLLYIFWLVPASLVPIPLQAESPPSDTIAHFHDTQALDEAKTLLEHHQEDDALRVLEEILNRSSDPSIMAQAYFLQAAVFRAKGEDHRAAIVLEQLLEEFPTTSIADEARLMLGGLYTTLAHPSKAEAVLRATIELTRDPHTRQEALRLLRDLYDRTGQYTLAIKTALAELDQIPESERRDILDYIHVLILQRMDESALNELLDQFPQQFPGDLALIRLIELHTARDDEVLAERDIRAFLHRFPQHPYAQTAVALLQAFMSKIRAHQQVVAAVFPFSGRLQSVGTEALNGVRLAIDDARTRLGPKAIGLVVKDSAMPATQLRYEVSQMLQEFEPVAVIGPLLSQEVRQLAHLPDEAQVPFLTPTATLTNVRQFGRFWFSTALTAELEIQTIVKYAMHERGYTRFCILHPQTSHGRLLSRLFQRMVQQLGGEIIAVESYRRGTTDVSAQVKRIQHRDLDLYGQWLPREVDHAEGTPLVYTPGFDAVFLPGTPADVAFIAAQLAFYDVKVPLLGNNGWNHPDLLRWGRSSIEGSVFSDVLFLDSSDPTMQAFIQRYQARFGRPPSIFAAQAYDAMHIVLDTIQRGARTGLDVRNQLWSRHDLPTVNGLASFGDGGILSRQLVLIQVMNGQFQQIQ
ncbi:MAG: hypothetical protein D6704_06855 [Nitrospirae bacterium]|nr:MAG: hypothetical protein D6704_06855 [Nitrospirota bacterium]